MRLTIIKDDDVVGIDGDFYTVDCSLLPEDFHALQWDGGWGDIEYKANEFGDRKPNFRIVDEAPYLHFVDAWYASKAFNAAQIEAEQMEAERAEKERTDAA